MTGRIYTARFENVPIAAVQDVFMLKAGAANPLTLQYITISAGGVSGAAEIRFNLKRLPATVTNGSGGTAPTISPMDSGDTKAAAATVRANDTVQATTSGTAAFLMSWQWNVLGPFEWMPTPELTGKIQASEALVLEIPGTPGASTTCSGTIQWEEP
jgi:hypothetical protein